MSLPPWLDIKAPPGDTPARQDMSANPNVLARLPILNAPSAAQSWEQWADNFERRIASLLSKRVKYIQRAFVAPALAVPLPIRPAEKRYWLFIQNTAAAGQLVLSFGTPPSPNGNAMTLNPLGLFEPEWVSQDEIWIAGAPAGTTGICIVATELDGA